MRITDAQRFDSTLRQIQIRSAALQRATDQAVTGRRWPTVSADPVSGRQVIEIDSQLRAVEQQHRAVSSDRARLTSEENILQQITDILSRVKELATGQGSANSTASTRASAAVEIRALREQVISLGNTNIGGEYLLAGFESRTPPFQADGTYVGGAVARQSAIGPALHTGQQVLIDTDILQTLTDLEAAMLADNPEAIRAEIASVDSGIDGTQALLAEIGTRSLNLEFVTATLDRRTDALTAHRTALAEIPLEEATLAMAAAHTALEAAYLATARIQSLSLTEYLR